jgi:S-adenosylmethionine:diacylglycerol 3-amino-3-carboxypropyl transferase
MIKRRALEIADLPAERREGRYEMIHDATRRASISNGQGEDEAVRTASSITSFVRAIVIMDAGARRSKLAAIEAP